MEGVASNPLGQAITDYLHNHSLSLRQFAVVSGVHVSTLSRLVNGKRQATAAQRRKLAPYIALPEDPASPALASGPGWSALAPLLGEISSGYDPLNISCLESQIVAELRKYELFSQTPEGERIIRTEFPGKVSQVAGIGPLISELEEMFQHYLALPPAAPERPVAGSALLYFVLSADAIPDYLFPIGYLDDALAIRLVVGKLRRIREGSPPPGT